MLMDELRRTRLAFTLIRFYSIHYYETQSTSARLAVVSIGAASAAKRKQTRTRGSSASRRGTLRSRGL